VALTGVYLGRSLAPTRPPLPDGYAWQACYNGAGKVSPSPLQCMAVSTERKFVSPGRSITAQPKGPVRLRFIESEGQTLLELGVDYEKADVPDRRYYADYCKVVESRSAITLIFGRLDPSNSALRTKVEISFPEALFLRQLWSSSREAHQKLEESLAGKHLAPLQEPRETDKIQGFRANNVFMASISDDAILDFYYIAPPDIHFVRIGKRSDVYLEPIIRIALGTPLMLEFLDQCRPHAERLSHASEEIRPNEK
jgi:hypothetical protein